MLSVLVARSCNAKSSHRGHKVSFQSVLLSSDLHMVLAVFERTDIFRCDYSSFQTFLLVDKTTGETSLGDLNVRKTACLLVSSSVGGACVVFGVTVL